MMWQHRGRWQLARRVALIAFAALLLVSRAAAYTALPKHSLMPPFDSFREHSGERELRHWTYGGSVIAKENFLRLTPDRQSKRGWLFNTERLEQDDFGIQMRFRISGSGRHLFGDGLALWLTQKKRVRPSFSDGSILGHTDSFTGFGIMFDTFRNAEHGHVHKDISLLASDGKEPVSLDKDRPGCESQYRYFEGREDFSVDNESVARIWLENNVLSLEVDKFGKGDFKECFKVDLAKEYGLKDSWQQEAHLALSASTGALADNHDLIELKVAEPAKFKHLLRVDEEERDMPSVQIDVHDKIQPDEVAEHVNDLAFELAEASRALSKLQHKQEHDLESVKMSLESMLSKLEKREDESQDRIGDLEKARQRQLDQKLEDRLDQLETKLADAVEARLATLEKRVGADVQEAKSSSGGWRIPLLIIVVLVGAYMAYTARSLKKLNQRDKLF